MREIDQAVRVDDANEKIRERAEKGWKLIDQKISNPQEGVLNIFLVFEREEE